MFSSLDNLRQEYWQGAYWKTIYQDNNIVNVGDVVCLKVDRREKASNNNRGLTGIVITKRISSGNCAIVTRFGLLVNDQDKAMFFRSDEFRVVLNPTLDNEMETLLNKVKSQCVVKS